MKILVALYDRAVEAYAPVMTVNTRAEAIRSFRQECNNKQGQLCQHPSDYELWQIGEYDDQTGMIVSTNERIARAEDYVEK